LPAILTRVSEAVPPVSDVRSHLRVASSIARGKYRWTLRASARDACAVTSISPGPRALVR
jgi:hypothetical protein